MSVADDEKLKVILRSLEDGMMSYMEEYEGVRYSKAHVDECIVTLKQFGKALDTASDHASAMECVKQTVIRLNDLNERGGGKLIETDQREDICQYIINYCMMTGYLERFEDVTEEWRDW